MFKLSNFCFGTIGAGGVTSAQGEDTTFAIVPNGSSGVLPTANFIIVVFPSTVVAPHMSSAREGINIKSRTGNTLTIKARNAIGDGAQQVWVEGDKYILAIFTEVLEEIEGVVEELHKIIRSPRTTNTILTKDDRKTLIDITGGTFTQTFTAAATLGSGWYCYYRNSGTGEVTLDPNAAETIDGATTSVVYPGEARLIQCNGTALFSVVLSVRPFTSSLIVSNWTIRTSAADNSWYSVCWSPGLAVFCAVANSGTGNRVMTSPDGITWTIRTSAADNSWFSVCWSPGLALFCAVAYTGTGNRVMTSPDGITWTIRTSAADNSWFSVCWSPGLALFCAVAISGTGNRVMTSLFSGMKE
ncbi:MAG: hypothetical protein Q8J68_14685 [Methanolobus sp.]|uniref:hypothetical protein n=1 Tax=Methanolobus sp. TaxID=1874737 RepID=UPI002731789D|nr:hypothetical protein [Methanolobus sp.]MDP2218521.1 hypothetical protein [Methanolobus sp.]